MGMLSPVGIGCGLDVGAVEPWEKEGGQWFTPLNEKATVLWRLQLLL